MSIEQVLQDVAQQLGALNEALNRLPQIVGQQSVAPAKNDRKSVV